MRFVDLLVEKIRFVFQLRLEEERDHENGGGDETHEDGLDGRLVWIDHLPRDEVLDGTVGRVESVPGEEDGEERGGVEHQRRHRVQEVRVKDQERLPVGSIQFTFVKTCKVFFLVIKTFTTV